MSTVMERINEADFTTWEAWETVQLNISDKYKWKDLGVNKLRH